MEFSRSQSFRLHTLAGGIKRSKIKVLIHRSSKNRCSWQEQRVCSQEPIAFPHKESDWQILLKIKVILVSPRNPQEVILWVPRIDQKKNAGFLQRTKEILYSIEETVQDCNLDSSLTAQIAASTSSKVLKIPKLNRTDPCGKVPRAWWARGAQ